jgi:hypothetical protein
MNCIINYPDPIWSTNNLTEQIYISLISKSESYGINLKYEKRARWLLRRFCLYDPPPEFIVYRKDLPDLIRAKLSSLLKESPKTLDFVMTRAIEMIFEGITEQDEEVFNYKHYLFSVKRYKLFNWRFDKREDTETDPNSKYDVYYDEFDSDGIVVGGILVRKKDEKANAC